MTIIPATVQHITRRGKGSIVFVPVLWVDGELTTLSDGKPRISRLAAFRTACAAGRRLFAKKGPSRAVLRRFKPGEEEQLMEAAQS